MPEPAPLASPEVSLEVSPEPTGWIRRLTRLIRPHLGDGVVALASSLLGNSAVVATPLIVRRIVDHSIGRNDGSLGLWVGVLAAIGMFRAYDIRASVVRRPTEHQHRSSAAQARAEPSSAP